MTVGLILRSLLALLLAVGVALLGLSQATVLPKPALASALSAQGEQGNGILFQVPNYQIPSAASPGTRQRARTGARRQRAIAPSAPVSQLPPVPGHIFYTAPDHNLYFVTGQRPRKQYTGNGTTVAPALSPDGSQLAFVEFLRNYSDIYVTSLGYDKATGAVAPMTTTWVTQDQSPPAALQQQGCQTPPGFQPQYGWTAIKPSFLPDGQHLLYVSNRPGFCPDPSKDVADNSVYEQGVTDTMTNAVRLTIPAPGTGGDDSPMWRPHDPAVFIYTHYYYGPELPNPEGIIQAAMAVTGTAPTDADITSLTPHGVLAELPAWSPDGHFIAFVEDHNSTTKRSDIKVMRFHRPGYSGDYAAAQTVAQGAPYVTQPFWSPKGDYLGYLTSSGGDFTLVIRRVKDRGDRLEFGPPIRIPQAEAADAGYRPAWGP